MKKLADTSANSEFLSAEETNETWRRILEIAQAGQDGRLGLLIGAGFSKSARSFPVGAELAFRLIKDATGSADDETVWKLVETCGLGAAAEYYCDQVTESRVQLRRVLEGVLNSGGAKHAKSEAEQHLASIVSICRLHRVFTTNFDALIEESLPAPRFVVVEPTAAGLIDFEQKRAELDCTGVFHLNGTVRDPKVTEADLKDYRPIFYEELKHELLTKVFVIVGYSFRDEAITKVFDEVGSMLRETREGRKTYLVMPVSNQLEYRVARSVWDSRGSIHLIPMNAADFFRTLESALGKLSYEDCVKKIAELVGEQEQDSDKRVDALKDRLEAFTQGDLAEVLCGLIEAGSA